MSGAMPGPAAVIGGPTALPGGRFPPSWENRDAKLKFQQQAKHIFMFTQHLL